MTHYTSHAGDIVSHDHGRVNELRVDNAATAKTLSALSFVCIGATFFS
jgi:hypothetical protein